MYIIPSVLLFLTCVSAQAATAASQTWKTEVPITANTIYATAGACARNCATSIFSSYSSKIKAAAPNSDCSSFPGCMCYGQLNQSIEKAIGLCASSSYMAKAQSCTASDILNAGGIFEMYCMQGRGLAQVQTMNPTSVASVVSVATRVAASATAMMTSSSSSSSSSSAASKAASSAVSSASQAAATSKSGGDTIQAMGSLEYIVMLGAGMLLGGW